VPPSVSANRNSSADIRTRFGQPLAAWLWMAGVHSSFPSERNRSIVVTELIELRFHASTRPPTKHTDEFLLLPTFQQTRPDKTKFSAGWSSFLTAKSSAPFGSSCQSLLCSSARRIQTRAVLASAPLLHQERRCWRGSRSSRLPAAPCVPSRLSDLNVGWRLPQFSE
jgi:hypothetical protein